MSDELKPSYAVRDYQSERVNDWCAGCGDFGILRALEKTLAGMQLAPDEVAIFGGIGCSGKTPYYLRTFGVHTLHGRVLPFAIGTKLASPALTVIAMGGDGDGLSIGAGHFVNAGRRNVDLTYIVFDNGVFGLTKGQASPTLREGEQTKSMPQPNISREINPLLLALVAGFTWIGRGYAYDVDELEGLMRQAIAHPGLAVLDVLQPCPTYNDVNDRDWYAGRGLDPPRPRLYSLAEEGYDPRVPDGAGDDVVQAKMVQCLVKAREWGDRIPTGVFYEDLSRRDFYDRLQRQRPLLTASPPALQSLVDEHGRSLADLTEVFEQLKVT